VRWGQSNCSTTTFAGVSHNGIGADVSYVDNGASETHFQPPRRIHPSPTSTPFAVHPESHTLAHPYLLHHPPRSTPEGGELAIRWEGICVWVRGGEFGCRRGEGEGHADEEEEEPGAAVG
jgi:hypothetical protein